MGSQDEDPGGAECSKAKAGLEKATKEEEGEKQRLAREDERRKTMEEQNAAKTKAAPIMI